MKKDPFYKSGFNSRFESDSLSFNEYVNQMREMIEIARVDLTEKNREIIIDANSPFEWRPAQPSAFNPQTKRIKNGILLVHGLFDSPSMLTSLADHYRKQQFLVRAILLPGHGTNPGDLIDVSYDEWIKATRYGIQSFNQEVDNLYLCGFSTGGALVLEQTLRTNIDYLKGLILLAPAIKLQRPIAILSNFDNLLHQTIGGMKWLTRNTAPDYAKYLSFTLNSAHQVYLLSRIINREIEQKPMDIPVCFITSADDEMLSIEAMLNFFSKNTHPNSQFILYSNNKKNISDKRIQLFPSAYPEKKILNFSHMCLPIAPDHPHYGEGGDYQDYLYFEEDVTPKPKIITEPVYFGAVSHTNLRQHFIKKLSFNPDFVNMINRVDEFLHTCTEPYAFPMAVTGKRI